MVRLSLLTTTFRFTRGRNHAKTPAKPNLSKANLTYPNQALWMYQVAFVAIAPIALPGKERHLSMEGATSLGRNRSSFAFKFEVDKDHSIPI